MLKPCSPRARVVERRYKRNLALYSSGAQATLQLGAEARLELECLPDEGVDALGHLGRSAHVRVERQPEVGLGDIPLAWLALGLGLGSGLGSG